jgi:DNA-binding transcriptional LysR family regulator
LAALSKEVGTPVIEQDGRRVRLTAAAELLLRHAHEIFTHLEHAESDLAQFRAGKAGTVRVGAFASAIRSLCAPMLSSLERQSGIRVEIQEVNDAANALLARKVDIALTMALGHGTADVRGSDDPRLDSWPLLDDVMDMALPLNHPLAGETSVHLSDLAADDWILGQSGTSCWRIARDACAESGFTPRTRHQAEDYSGFVALIAAGAAVGLLPRLAQEPFRHDPIALIPVVGSPARHIVVQYRAGTENQPHIKPVLDAFHQIARLGHAPESPAVMVGD